MSEREPADTPADSEAELRVDELAEAFLSRLQAGEVPDKEALLSAHPEIADLLEQHLALVEVLHGARLHRSAGGSAVGPDQGGRLEGAPVPQQSDPPDKVGPYSILKVLGVGGMGAVYLAEQVQPVRRQVALKLIKLGMDTREVVARFDTERQALALMNHPNIARVFEAGAAEGGRPYFVMEHVPGEPIADFCDNRRMTTRERLELFEQVCGAIQHAHQKGVIHRDLKPSNILVMVADGEPMPKIIDFGVAKATHQTFEERTALTEQGRLIGTLEYMSPEQAVSDSLDVDTRTDIYSLGAILYELLVGIRPFDSDHLRKLPYDEIRRKLREDEPLKPSARLGMLGRAGQEMAQRRRSDSTSLARLLGGDLDWIVMKAMEKDRTRRYATASELAADIVRHLGDEPVLARPPSPAYRLKKLMRRHRGAVIGVVAVGVALLSGLGVSTTLYLQADAEWERAEEARQSEARQREEAERLQGAAEEAQQAEEEQRLEAERQRAVAQAQRDKAEKEAAKASAINDFLQEMLSSVDPAIEGREVKVAEVLGRAEKEIGNALGEHPGIVASLRDTIGGAYRSLGLYEEAEPNFRIAVRIYRRALGEEHWKTLRSVNNFAGLLQDQGKLSEAEPLFRRVLAARLRLFGDKHPHTLASMNNLANLLQARGNLAEAETLFRRTLEEHRRALGEDHLDSLRSTQNLAGLLEDQGKLAEAEPMLRSVLEARRRMLGDDHPDTLISVNNLAHVLQLRGNLTEAEPLYRQALEGRRLVLGEEHPDTLTSINNLGFLLRDQGKFAEAEPLFRKAAEVHRDALGDEHPNTLIFLNNLAGILQDQGKFVEAEPLLREVLRIRRRVLGEDHPMTFTSTNNLAAVLHIRGKITEAEPLLRQVLEATRRVLGKDHPKTLFSTNNLATSLEALGKVEEAETLYRQALEACPDILGSEHPMTYRLMNNLGTVLRTRSRLGEAEPLLRQCLKGHLRVLGGEHPETLGVMSNLALLLQDRDRFAEAERMFRQVLESYHRLLGDEHPDTLIAMINVVDVLHDRGELGEAEAMGRRTVQMAQKALPEGDWRIAYLQTTLGECLTSLRRYEEAEGHLLPGYEGMQATLGGGNRLTRKAIRRLIRLYTAWDKPERAEEMRWLLQGAGDAGGKE